MGGEFRYAEYYTAHAGFTTDIENILCDRRSSYQRITVVESRAVGRMLLLDGAVMVTEWDEFIYHEMLVHPALFLLPQPRRVLVIGGGDGGTVREILRHPSLEHVDLVEIDAEVVAVAREFFPALSAALMDPRVCIYYRDGAQFVAQAPDASYDAIFVDSTDPVGIAGGLFDEAFYRHCCRIVTAEGVLALQSESPLHPVYRETLPRVHRLLRPLFAHVASYLAPIPTYPTGLWSFTLASKRWDPVDDFVPEDAWQRYRNLQGTLHYYDPGLHRAVFALPVFVQRLLASGSPSEGSSDQLL
ncbi:Polyamine aminopropyltransferase [bacterium HR21]|nr:Polyamine aminopropyltransferase [bacterium HR21]